MKRNFYILAFVVLGVLLQFLAHVLIETFYLRLLFLDFSRYGFGLSWSNWFLIHHIGSVILLIIGVLFGFWQGRYWWTRLYDENGNRRLRRTSGDSIAR